MGQRGIRYLLIGDEYLAAADIRADPARWGLDLVADVAQRGFIKSACRGHPSADLCTARRHNRLSEWKNRLRSQTWFNDPNDPGETASTIDRYTAWGLTRAELQSGRPIISIAQSGSELTPCNRVHIALASRIKDGVREAGGVPIEFPSAPDSGNLPQADGSAGSQPGLSRADRNSVRISV